MSRRWSLRDRGAGDSGSWSIWLIVGGTLGVGCVRASFRDELELRPALRMAARISLTERSCCSGKEGVKQKVSRMKSLMIRTQRIPDVLVEEDEIRSVGGAIDGGFVYLVWCLFFGISAYSRETCAGVNCSRREPQNRSVKRPMICG
jgi:hypothetical protein